MEADDPPGAERVHGLDDGLAFGLAAGGRAAVVAGGRPAGLLRQLLAGKLRLTSTPWALTRVPAARASGVCAGQDGDALALPQFGMGTQVLEEPPGHFLRRPARPRGCRPGRASRPPLRPRTHMRSSSPLTLLPRRTDPLAAGVGRRRRSGSTRRTSAAGRNGPADRRDDVAGLRRHAAAEGAAAGEAATRIARPLNVLRNACCSWGAC